MGQQEWTTAGSYTFTVPDQITQVKVTVQGAEGGESTTETSTGWGGEVTGNLSVTPGENLEVYVGGKGGTGDNSGGFNGGGNGRDTDDNYNSGGGGGASDIRQGGTSLSDRVVVAAGGGGAGAGSDEFTGGGHGGASIGEDTFDTTWCGPATGGSQSSGGSGGSGGGDIGMAGSDGSLGSGGNCGYTSGGFDDPGGAGGGGGGGYYGGGGGGSAAFNDNPDTDGVGGAGGSNYAGGLTSANSYRANNQNTGYVKIEWVEPPAPPENVTTTYVSDSQIDLSADEDTANGGTVDNYDVEIKRDDGSWVTPAGGPSNVSDSGGSMSASYGPSEDGAFGAVVGIDSTFEFRVRANNAVGTSDWTVSNTVQTSPIAPDSPRASRPSASEVSLGWTITSDIEDGTEIQYREDTGTGYGAWTALTTTGPGATGYDDTGLLTDIRRQYRARTVEADGKTSDWVYADYGNGGNIYFEDSFESGDVSQYESQDLSKTSTPVQSGSFTEAGISGAAEGSNYLRLRDTDYVMKQLGDLSAETDVQVRVKMACGSLAQGEEGVLLWYDGSSYTELKAISAASNRQGWQQVTAPVPDGLLTDDCRVMLRGLNSSDSTDYSLFDDLVVSDVLHEYTDSSPVSILTVDTPTQRQITASWSDDAVFEDGYTLQWRRSSEVTWPNSRDLTPGTEMEPVTDRIRDGEEYQMRVRPYIEQYRRGSLSSTFTASWYTNSNVTILPAPTALESPSNGSTSIDVTWTDNHNYGETVTEYKPADTGTWQSGPTVSRDTETATITGLRTGEEYDVRVLASTEHATTEDT